MSAWGALLLATYLALGLSPIRATKALAMATTLTIAVLLAVTTGIW